MVKMEKYRKSAKILQFLGYSKVIWGAAELENLDFASQSDPIQEKTSKPTTTI